MRKLLLSVMFLFISANIFGAELGAGGGSGYPAALDTDATPESDVTLARSNVPNDLADAIIKIQTELGTDPAGTAATVDNRIDIRSAARAYLSASQENIVHGDFYKVLFDTENYDVGADFNVSESTFTVPITGYYAISTAITWTNTQADTEYIISIQVNNVDVAQSYSQTSLAGAITSNINTTLYLTAAAGIQIVVYNNHGADDTVDIAATTFSWVDIRMLPQ